MHYVYLLTGSNCEDRLTYLNAAKTALVNRIGTLVSESDIYESAAWGVEDQGNFLNQAFCFETRLTAPQLLLTIKDIEVAVGRTATYLWGPREIDIDILMYCDKLIDTYDLIVPHPEFHKRRFALEPLASIAPDLVHPILEETIQELLTNCTDKGWVKLFKTVEKKAVVKKEVAVAPEEEEEVEEEEETEDATEIDAPDTSEEQE